MEQRLFAVACVMYAFTLLTRYLKKKEKLSTSMAFGVWHGSFLLVIAVCLVYFALFAWGGKRRPYWLGKGYFVGLCSIGLQPVWFCSR